MDELMDMIATEESPSNISDKIKSILYQKSVEKIDGYRPLVADYMFNGESEEDE